VFRAHRALSTEVREAAELPDRVRELLILRTAWRTQCEYEWAQHQAMAPAAGIGDHELRALTRELDASPWDEADRAVLAAADELCAFDCITESTWSALAARFDAPALVLLTFTVGVYRSLAGFLNSAGVPLDAGLSGWPE
jgi:alkylhydroperoxidase family enzyme